MMIERLLPGETYEVGNVYVGDHKVLFARLVLYRLTEKQLRERRKNKRKTKRKRKSYSEKSRILSGLNIYVTNTPWEWVPMKQVHELYSLRWQIEIVFKTWKSLFDIDHCRTVKQERIECHLYGKLIAIFLCSSTMFKMRQLLLQKKQKELSEYKAIGMIQDHLFLLYQAIQNTQEITKLLIRLFHLLEKTDGNLTDMKKKQSLISWVFIMSIV